MNLTSMVGLPAWGDWLHWISGGGVGKKDAQNFPRGETAKFAHFSPYVDKKHTIFLPTGIKPQIANAAVVSALPTHHPVGV